MAGTNTHSTVLTRPSTAGAGAWEATLVASQVGHPGRAGHGQVTQPHVGRVGSWPGSALGHLPAGHLSPAVGGPVSDPVTNVSRRAISVWSPTHVHRIASMDGRENSRTRKPFVRPGREQGGALLGPALVVLGGHPAVRVVVCSGPWGVACEAAYHQSPARPTCSRGRRRSYTIRGPPTRTSQPRPCWLEAAHQHAVEQDRIADHGRRVQVGGDCEGVITALACRCAWRESLYGDAVHADPRDPRQRHTPGIILVHGRYAIIGAVMGGAGPLIVETRLAALAGPVEPLDPQSSPQRATSFRSGPPLR